MPPRTIIRSGPTNKFSDNWFRSLIENSNDVITLFDAKGIITYSSPSVTRVLGYEPEECLGHSLFENIHPDDVPHLQQKFKDLLKEPDLVIRAETRYRHKNGDWLWIEGMGRNLLDDPAVQAIVVSLRDVTARKEAELKLNESERRLSTLMSNLPGMAYRCLNDKNWTMEFLSSGCNMLTGYKPEQFTSGQISYNDIVHPEDSERIWDEVQDAVREVGHFTFEYRIRTASDDEKWVWEQGCGVFDADGTLLHLEGFITDISERVRAQEKLYLFGLLLKNSINEIYVFDANSLHFLQVSDGAVNNLGYSVKELQQLTPVDLKPLFTHDSFKQLISPLRTGKQKSLYFETIHRRKDGTTYPVEVQLQFMRRENPVFFAIIQDITERKEAYYKILRLNRVYKMLGEINSLIVHVQDRQELFEESCRIAVEAGGFRLAWIGTVSKEKGIIVPQASSGHEDGYLQHIHIVLGQDDPGKDSASGKAVHTGQPAIHNDIAGVIGDFPWKQEALKRGYTAAAAVPLIIADEVVGVMSLYSTESGFFDDEEMKLLMELANDISYALQNIMQREQFEYLSSYDPLTGLANRILFNNHLNSVLGRASKNKKKVALLVCDLKQFRHINNVYGRHAGDRILQETAKRLRGLTSDPVNIGRISNDNFVMILHDVRDATGAAYRFENALFPSLNKPFVINGNEVQINFAGGIAVFPADGDDAEELYRNAEAALKRAKQGGEQYLFYRPEMTTRIAETLQLESKLRIALKKEQFVLHYQPKINTLTRKITGLEALIRWNDPDTGLVPPMKFIPILEETGLILDVGMWALDRAASDYRLFRKKLGTAPRIAVNVSSVQLQQKDFVEQVEKAIRHGGPPVALDLEITESLIMTGIEQNISKLKALRLSGLGVAIDDFGTGYSSLSYIARLPIDALKIDRSFIKDMTTKPESMSIVSSIITLAHSLNFKVIAEGVETEEQAKFLGLLICDELQGFLFSKPLPADEIFELLRSGKAL